MNPARCEACALPAGGRPAPRRLAGERATGCAVLKAPRSTYRHRPRRGAQAELRKRVREVAKARVRHGHRRIHALLRRGPRRCALDAEGWLGDGCQAGVAALPAGRPAAAPNEVRTMDFLSARLFDGTRIRVLTIVDAHSRASPAIHRRAAKLPRRGRGGDARAGRFLSPGDARQRCEVWRGDYCQASQHPSGYAVESGSVF